MQKYIQLQVAADLDDYQTINIRKFKVNERRHETFMNNLNIKKYYFESTMFKILNNNNNNNNNKTRSFTVYYLNIRVHKLPQHE